MEIQGNGSGGGGSSIELQTNGLDNGDQTLLNLIQGTNITLTDDGLGGVTIDASGGGGTPASPDTSIQFNNSGAFGGDDNLKWDAADQIIAIGNPDIPNLPDGATVGIAFGNSSTNSNGYISIQVQDETTGNNDGMQFDIYTSQGHGSGAGGRFTMGAGNGGATGDGGDFNLNAGNATSGNGGGFFMTGGNSDNGNGGSVFLQPGINSIGGGINGNVIFVDPSFFNNAIIDTSLLSGDQTYSFPDKSGTFAMLSDITGLSIGSPVGSGTSQSVLFLDGSANLAQDNTYFKWDDSSHFLEIGAIASAGVRAEAAGILTLSAGGAGSQLYFNSTNGHTDFRISTGYLLNDIFEFGSGGTNFMTINTNGQMTISGAGASIGMANTGLGDYGFSLVGHYYNYLIIDSHITNNNLEIICSSAAGGTNFNNLLMQFNPGFIQTLAPVYMNNAQVNMAHLPTSASGLATGDLWVDLTSGLNILKIV